MVFVLASIGFILGYLSENAWLIISGIYLGVQGTYDFFNSRHVGGRPDDRHVGGRPDDR